MYVYVVGRLGTRGMLGFTIREDEDEDEDEALREFLMSEMSKGVLSDRKVPGDVLTTTSLKSSSSVGIGIGSRPGTLLTDRCRG